MNDTHSTHARATARSYLAPFFRIQRIVSTSPGATKHGFTLIELLIVCAILVALLGMLMPLLGIANRTAKASATRSVMAKVDTAVRLFKADIGSYPFQRTYADLAAGAAWSNRLNYHLGSDITNANLTNVRADADAAAARYNPSTPVSPFAFVKIASVVDESLLPMLNRMAAERARLAIYAGNIEITGPKPQSPIVLSTAKLVTTPQSADTPGWASDLLAGELEARYIAGEAVLDAWGRQLLYVCQVVEGVTSAPSMIFATNAMPSTRYGMQPLGRTTLADKDALTSTTLVVHADRLPDLANLRHSDRRYYAAPGLETDAELWSAGPDGTADWMRDAPANRDNVSLLPYDKSLP